MQRHRNDEIETAAAQPRVIQGFAEPPGEGIAKVALVSVFEFVDQLANKATTSVGGYGAIEVDLAMLAIGATKGLGDRARKGLRAFRAERRCDPGRAALAIATEVFRAP